MKSQNRMATLRGNGIARTVDVGRDAGVVGVNLSSYVMIPTPSGSKVEFLFANGRRIVLEEANDVTGYTVI